MASLYRAWLALRALFFWLLFLPGVMIAAVLVSALFFLSIEARMVVVKAWIAWSLGLLRVFCGLTHQVEGLENIPDEGFIVMSKHSSTWETIALQKYFNPMIWVVKRELTWVPFFGWGLKSMGSIALNRGTGRKAINQLIEESEYHMSRGRILMLFPEGTRVPPGQKKPFKIGGAVVSVKTGYSILPIAHNAGEFWPRHSWIKWPGTIRISIGKPISAEGKTVEQIIAEVGEWITAETARLSDSKQLQRLGLTGQQ